ncbi:origin recognition complex subunit 4 isoform X3 [Panulirus ornatus]|uniref:origin recognition complex subunit 4 isoform X3 n=1 Tax=Panulirus ornatus TaxID=150431 RepID=UPI003A84D55C
MMGLKRKNSAESTDLNLLNDVQKQLRVNLQLWGATHDAGERLLSLYSVEAQHLEELVTRTLTLGESNSALIVAPRGTGKSSLVNTVLEKLESSRTLGEGLVVRLSGLLQTDDRLALKEITCQLKLENATANKVFGSFAENLAFLLESLRSGSKETSKPVIFILDEFDLFCHHRNQTLLYNLFDVAQSAQNFAQKWNSDVAVLAKDSLVIQVLKRLHSITKDVRTLKTFLLLCVCQLNSDQAQLTSQMFQRAQSLSATEAKTNMLQGLSVLQLCLIVAMKHLTVIYEGEPFNFEMVFHEYLKFSQQRSTMQSFEQPVVFKAFDQLKSLELVRTVESTRGTQREYQLVKLMMEPNHVVKALSQLSGIPTDLQQWAASSLA